MPALLLLDLLIPAAAAAAVAAAASTAAGAATTSDGQLGAARIHCGCWFCISLPLSPCFVVCTQAAPG
jgi:hypothetical protein